MTEGREDPGTDRADGDDPVLPQTTSDEHDIGWGDDPESADRDEEWYRRERPPHHE
jgi:hypothetical protein